MISDRILLEVAIGLLVVNTLFVTILIRGVCNMSAATDAFATSVAKLTTDVDALIKAVTGGTAAAVDAFATAAKAQIDTIDASVVAATPPPPAPAP